MSDPQDRADLAAVALGDERALAALHRRHAGKLFRYVLRLAQDAQLAEEIVNDAFVELWRKADTFRGDAAVSTWLLSIARFRAIDRLRRRREAPLDEEAAARVPDEAEGPHERLAGIDRATLLRRMIERLSPTHREILDLVYYQEQSVAEAALVLGIPEGTVKTRMFNARRNLAQLIDAAKLQEALA